MLEPTFWLWLGLAGQALFFARFFVQWIASERHGRSVVPTAFWFFSIGGGLTLLAYAVHRRDPVFILGQSVGLLIYGRNLWLIRRERRQATEGAGGEAAGGEAAAAPAPDAARRRRLPDLALVVAGAAVLFLPALGAHDLWNPDEARYAQVAREMLQRGDYLVPRLNGQVYSEKPPLLFWAIAAASLPWGTVTETSARLPSALAGIAAVAAVFLLAGRLFGRRAAWLAAAVFATSAKTLWQARFGQIDMLLCALVVWAMWWWVRADRERRPRLYALFFLFTGLATLAKGPVGLVPPLLAVVAFLLVAGRRPEVRAMRLGRGLLIWAAVVAAWLVPAGIAGGAEYAETLLWRQNVVRYAEPWHHHQPWHYYLTVVPADFLPWSLLLPAALAAGWRAWGRRREGGDGAAEAAEAGGARPREGFLLALAWVVTTLVFFSLSPGKRSVYVFSMYPGLALLVGAGLDRLAAEWEAAREGGGERRPPSRAWLTVPLAALAALFAAAVVAVPLVGRGRPEAAALGDRFVVTLAGVLGALALAAAFATAFAARRRVALAVGTLAGGAAAALLAVAALLLPALDLFKSARPLARAFVAATPAGAPFAVYPHLDSTVLFYSGRPAVPFDSPEELRAFLARPGRGWVFVGRHDLERVTAGDPPLVLVAAETPAERDGYLLLAETPDRSSGLP